MPLESATYIMDLVSSNPDGATDPKSDGDNHIRLIKAALRATFPDATGVVRFTAFIKTLLDDPDAATALTTLGALPAASAYIDPLTVRGDLLYKNSATVTARLPIGVVNRILRSDGVDPSWQLVNLPSDVTGILPAASTPDFDALTIANNPPSTAFVAGSIAPATNRKLRVGEVGGWSALEEQTAAASANLDFVLSSYLADFEDFEFIFDGLVPFTDGDSLAMRFSTDGGATYDSGAANYGYDSAFHNSTGYGTNSSASDNHIEICPGQDNAASSFLSGTLKLFHPGDAGKRTTVRWDIAFTQNASTLLDVGWGMGRRLTNQDTDAVRFLYVAGATTSGKITMMGRRKVT